MPGTSPIPRSSFFNPMGSAGVGPDSSRLALGLGLAAFVVEGVCAPAVFPGVWVVPYAALGWMVGITLALVALVLGGAGVREPDSARTAQFAVLFGCFALLVAFVPFYLFFFWFSTGVL